MKKLTVIILIACLLLAACQPAVQVMATPGNLATAGNYATAGNAVTPGNVVTAGNAATPSNAEAVPPDVDKTAYPALTQTLMDKTLAAFFAGSDVRYFHYDDDENAENIWLDKPLINETVEGDTHYEIMDVKAYADGVVYDMWSYHKLPDVGFNFAIYGRNLMTQEQVDALRPSDGVAWMSLQQGLISAATPEAVAASAENAISQAEALQRAQAFLTAVGCEAVEPELVEATFRCRIADAVYEGEPEEASREYGWLFTFHPLDYETIQIGVTAAGYGQLWWTVEF